MSSTEPVPRSEEYPPPPSDETDVVDPRASLLTERQRSYLRLVLQLKNSKEIAAATGAASYRAVDKQLLKANAILGVSTRFEAAQLFAALERGVEPLHPANALPSHTPTSRFSPPWPTAGAAANMLTWKQVAAWTAIIAIVTPLGLTAAGMAYVTLLFLLRFLQL
ncbi:helix-turn-helix domain-containing protein [Rhizorhapis suberifaciens]|uniref:DNA-binding CsgD family transcriptional regulator n=1 Tax=Rhizorhapis suberifaciens TaxID=13656 RepID=A0A840HYQ6_9SPHN|nr:RNA polymerase subunit sigma-70 [Rhizorhapis suberifaciens]MBB4642727.1 DNA-binding CsgD family transcriptional regulator [Rhizorhapis suberifaciens]